MPIWRYTCTACELVVRVGHQAAGAEIVACQCQAAITEVEEPETESGA
jgi:predicted nucleic acid-binding Zn ribbon protein